MISSQSGSKYVIHLCIPADVLNGVDTSHGVQLKVTYGDVSVDSKGVRLTRAQTASAPSVEVSDLVGNLLSKLKLQESSLCTLIICDPGRHCSSS